MIKVLTEDVINKIAAGEIVQRPASVLKELIENSLDADASEITVDVKNSGKDFIKVTDNGVGMSKQDAILSLERHATSKIAKASDLNRISTLGFRGEALPSIAGVSRLLLITKSKGESAGVKIYIEGGSIREVKETGAPFGTMMEVRSLFFNTPARRKFLKTDTTEFHHIVDVFSRYAVVYTNCGFKLLRNNETVMQILSQDTLIDRIRVIYGKGTADNLIPIRFQKEGISISGYVSKPNFCKPNRSSQFIFVNKRPIISRTINYAVYEGYGNLVPKGRFPIVFLFLELLSDTIDINVHPAKSEVKFLNKRLIQQVTGEAISRALQEADLTPRAVLNAGNYNSVFMHSNPPAFSEASAPFGGIPQQSEISGIQHTLHTEDAEGIYAVQMNNSYIIREVPDGFEIIDQHAAHERVMYEKIKDELKKQHSTSQRLLIPLTLELSSEEDEILKAELPLFEKLGFNINEFGRHSVIIDMIPYMFNKVDILQLIKDMFSDLKGEGSTSQKQDIEDRIIKSMACHAAIKQGDKLDGMEIKKLLIDWQRLPNHYTCPHGRPSVVKMSNKELNKQFHRT